MTDIVKAHLEFRAAGDHYIETVLNHLSASTKYDMSGVGYFVSLLRPYKQRTLDFLPKWNGDYQVKEQVKELLNK